MSYFNTKMFYKNLAIKVNDGTKLFVNSKMLSESSPVFAKEICDIFPDENGELVVELPWTDMDELLLFLTFLLTPRSSADLEVQLMQLNHCDGVLGNY